VIGQDEVRTVRDAEVACIDAALRELVQLSDQCLEVDDDAGADDADDFIIQDAGWNEMQLECALVGLDGMAGIAAAIGPACLCLRRPTGRP
jgi:hypothetical protein